MNFSGNTWKEGLQIRKKINVVSLGYNDSLPFEQEHICDIVAFTQDISKDTFRIAPSYLIG